MLRFCSHHKDCTILHKVTHCINIGWFSINLTFSSSFASEEPISIPTLVKNNAKEVPNDPAMKTKDPKTGEEVRVRFFQKKRKNPGLVTSHKLKSWNKNTDGVKSLGGPTHRPPPLTISSSSFYLSPFFKTYTGQLFKDAGLTTFCLVH